MHGKHTWRYHEKLIKNLNENLKLNEILFESILDFLWLALTTFANCPYNKSQANITYTPHVGKQNIMLHVHKCHAHATNTHAYKHAYIHTQSSTQMRRL